MLDKNQIAAASKTLHDHWRAGTKCAGIDADQRPRDRAEGYAIQASIEKYSSEPLFGWKIAATSEAGQKHINVDGPMAGRILAETVISDGGTASMAGNEMRVAEPEFAFRMRVDLPARSTPYTLQQVLDAVDTLHPAIEIPDSRFQDFVSAGAAQIIADNACAHLFVLGPAGNDGLACARSRRGETCHHVARPAIHRPRQERARRSPRGTDVARQRTAPARHDAESRPRGYDRHLPPAAADPVGRFLCR
jgi:2-keto-4-pentenoate hydratase